MQQFWQQVVSGLADGSIFASLALALVLIYRATGIINFAQGEMGMFSTYIAWSLITHHGVPFWPAFVLTLALSFLGGIGVQRVVIRPIERANELTIVMATIALLVILNGLAGWIWTPQVQAFPSAFPNKTVTIGGVILSVQDLGTLGIVLGTVLVVWLFFQYTRVGLALRAAALRPDMSRLLGVRVSWMLALGWGLAAILSAIAGMLAAPTIFLDPNFMQTVLIYAFAAAVLGGIDSPIGAVVGGLVLGVALNLLGTYVHFVTAELRLPVALAFLLGVLILRPGGLLGRVAVRRV